MGYALFISSFTVYVYQQRELNLYTLEKSISIVNEVAEYFKIDLATIKQCMIY